MRTWLLLFVIAALISAAAPTRLDVPTRSYTRNDELLIARALAEGRRYVYVLIAADPPQVPNLKASLERLGARIEYESADLGYLRARVPLSDVDALAAMPVQRIDIDADTQFDVELDGFQTTQAYGAAKRSRSDPYPWPTPNDRTRQANAFTGVRELQAAAFKAAHPMYDGRGVRIGFLEREDPMSPFLQRARTLDGRIVPKLVDMRNAVRPNELTEQSTDSDREYFGWVNMHARVRSVNGHFAYDGHTWTAPYDGSFRIGVFSLRNDVHFSNVLHPHGTAYARSQQFPILWDRNRGVVWVDARQSGNFARAKPMMDYRIHHDIGFLDVELKDWSLWGEHYVSEEPVPHDFDYVVETDPADGYVAVHMPFHSIHGTGVASTAVGEGYFDGAFDGVAPGAQMVSLVAGEAPYSGAIEALIDAARYPGVNLISLSWGACFFAQDGASVMDVIVNRLVDRYGVLPFISASNDGPAMSTLCSPSIADDAVSVGAYTSREMFAGNDGAAVSDEDYLAYYSSRGPRRDGGFKPDLVAPTEVLGAHPMVAPRQLLQHWLLLPVGYGVTNGTSTAAPMAAGAAALLVSAAMQAGIPHDPLRIKRALVAGARQLTKYGAAEQGGGLIDVVAAWRELKKMAKDDPIVIEATAPVHDVSSGRLTTPNEGQGVYEREGWHARMTADRTYTFYRTNGPTGDMNFRVRWIHDDRTFASASSISLPLDAATSFTVHIAPAHAGAHSAILELIDPRNGAVADERMNVIVAAEQLNRGDDFTIKHRGTVGHPGVVHYFVNVPHGTGAFSIQLKVARRDLANVSNIFVARSLLEVHLPSGRRALPFTVLTTHDGALWSEAFAHPEAGVWEIMVNDLSPDGFTANPHQLRPLPPAAYTIDARAIGLSSTRAGASRSTLRYSLVNEMAPVHLRAAPAPLGRLRVLNVVLSPAHPRRAIAITVPPNASLVRAAIATSEAGAPNIDVFLFNCAEKSALAKRASYLYQGSCEFRESASTDDGGVTQDDGERLPAGHWVAVISAPQLVGPVNVRYSDIVASPVYGMGSITIAQATLASGEGTTITMRIAPGKGAPKGTELVAIPVLAEQSASTIYTQSHALTIDAMLTERPKPLRLYPIVWETIGPKNLDSAE